MPTKVQSIPLSGLSTSPSDYSVPDGHLSSAIGFIHEDGSLLNICHTSPKVLVKMPDGLSVIYQHNINTYTILILQDSDGRVYWYTYTTPDTTITVSELTPFVAKDGSHLNDIINCISIGNILKFTSYDLLYYYRFEEENTSYYYLGNDLPEINLQFKLTTYRHYLFDRGTNSPFVFYGTKQINWTHEYSKTDIPEADVSAFTDAVFGAINQANDFAEKKEMFLYPFLVRYAIRLYDGSLVKHSAPILMLPGTRPPYVCIDDYQTENGHTTLYYHAQSYPAKMQYYISSEDKQKLEAWKELVAGIDIFISQPIYTYRQDEQCKSMLGLFLVEDILGALATKELIYGFKYFGDNIMTTQDSGLVFKYSDDPFDEGHVDYYPSGAPGSKNYKGSLYDKVFFDSIYTNETFRNALLQQWGPRQKWGRYSRPDEGILDYITFCPVPFCCADVPMPTDEQLWSDIRNCSNFYLAKSMDVDDIDTNEFKDFDFDAGTAANIVSHQSMTDDFESHDKIIPSIETVYNSRLNISDTIKTRFGGFDLSSTLQYSNARFWDDNAELSQYDYAVFIKTDRGDVVVGSLVDKANGGLYPAMLPNLDYFFWPDTRAYKAVFFDKSSQKKTTIKLKEHIGLHGSVYCSKAANVWEDYTAEEFESFKADCIKRSNVMTNDKSVIYTSDTSNPFVFRAANVEQVGSGRIIALMPAAQALSQGQFGEFPMYAFTTDGIWALSVSDTGGFKAKQPIARDVPIVNEKGEPCILQLDQSIIFATERGLMHLAGSKVECISEVFDGTPDQWFAINAAHVSKVLTQFTDIPYSADLFTPFREYLRDGHMHYDYTHQRIIISNPGYGFCFVFGMKDRLWSVIPIRVTSAINSYPESYAMASVPVSVGSPDGSSTVSIGSPTGSSSVLIDFTSHDTLDDTRNLPMPRAGYLLTRPLNLGQPDILKTVSTVFVRGNLSRTSASIILYGSRDLTNWHIVGSSSTVHLHNLHGTPYKYFRVAIISRLSPSESITSLTIEYEERQTNKLR